MTGSMTIGHVIMEITVHCPETVMTVKSFVTKCALVATTSANVGRHCHQLQWGNFNWVINEYTIVITSTTTWTFRLYWWLLHSKRLTISWTPKTLPKVVRILRNPLLLSSAWHAGSRSNYLCYWVIVLVVRGVETLKSFLNNQTWTYWDVVIKQYSMIDRGVERVWRVTSFGGILYFWVNWKGCTESSWVNWVALGLKLLFGDSPSSSMMNEQQKQKMWENVKKNDEEGINIRWRTTTTIMKKDAHMHQDVYVLSLHLYVLIQL